LIKLRDDWENMIRDTNYQIFSYGVDNRVEEVEGITMLSMLFCSHGGLITPILYPHNNIVEFVTNNALSDDIRVVSETHPQNEKTLVAKL